MVIAVPPEKAAEAAPAYGGLEDSDLRKAAAAATDVFPTPPVPTKT